MQQIDVPRISSDARHVRAFALGGANGSTISEAIESLFKESAKEVNVNIDLINDQLLVTADAAQLELIEQTLEQFAPPKRELQIIQLDATDPYSFKLAADALFEDEPSFSAPSISIDSDQQQVLVRATT